MKSIVKRFLISVFIIGILVSLLIGFLTNFNIYKKEDIEKTAKPNIYLYPEKQQEISVILNYDGILTCTYPDYKEGWNVIAGTDGTLFNLEDKKEYSYLFWEGKTQKINWDLSEGFIVKGEDTKEFLQEKLSEMGLIPKEYNEFIVYWLPQMKHNKYNLIHFAGKEYEELAELKITPQPDSILRVFMVFKPLDRYIKLKEQKIIPFHRKGFTVVEWGGTEVK